MLKSSISPSLTRPTQAFCSGRVAIRVSRRRTCRQWGKKTNFVELLSTDCLCRMDPLRDDTLIYEHVLREEYDVLTKLDVYAGVPHCAPDFFPMLPLAEKALRDLKDGVEWILSQKRT